MLLNEYGSCRNGADGSGAIILAEGVEVGRRHKNERTMGAMMDPVKKWPIWGYRARSGRASTRGSRRVFPLPATRAVRNLKLQSSAHSISMSATHWSGYRSQIWAQVNGSETAGASVDTSFICVSIPVDQAVSIFGRPLREGTGMNPASRASLPDADRVSGLR
jgi:hypothetical protein